MQFGADGWLVGLLAVPLIWLILRAGDSNARRRLRALLGERAAEHVEHENRRLRAWRRLLLLSGVLWLVLALARPQWGAHDVVVKERGTDVVVALDISNSMLAQDVSPSRLELAKSELGSFLGGLRRGRVGLVLFAGAAFVQCPLTLDYETARQFLRQASPDMLTTQGTAVASALASSRELLDRGGGGGERAQRAIILVTDGEDLEGGWQEQAQRCREAGIVTMAIGVGEPAGGLIPVVDSQGRPAGFLRDETGNVVMSRCDPALLGELAEMTGGAFVQLGAGGLDRTRLQGVLAQLGERELEERRISAYEERFMWPLALAFICLGLRTLIRPRRTSEFNQPRARALSAAVVCMMLALLLCPAGAKAGSPLRPDGAGMVDRGRELYRQEKYEEALHAFEAARALNPDDPRLTNAVGAALFQLGRKEEASREFQRAVAQAEADEVKAESLYHAGTARLALGDRTEAVRLLEESLRLDPARVDARRNLELALRQQAQPQQQDQGENDEKKQTSGEEGDQQQQQNQQQAGNQQPEDERQRQQKAADDPADASQDPSRQEQAEQQAQEDQQPSPAQPQPREDSAQDGEPTASADPMDQQADDMTRERALGVLRALDRDEAELRRSIQKRVRGGEPRSGKQW